MASSGVVRSGDTPNTCVKYCCPVCSINSERRNVPAKPMHGTPACWQSLAISPTPLPISVDTSIAPSPVMTN